MKRLFFAFCLIWTAFSAAVFCRADTAAQLDIAVSLEPAGYSPAVTDSARYTKQSFSAGGRITVHCEETIASLYLIWDAPAPTKTILLSGGKLQSSENGFIHDFIPLDSPSDNIVLAFDSPAVLCDIYAFSEGEAPDWIQQWEKSDSPCDILFLPTHADDEMLYFGGAMALAAERESEIQVAYMVNHNGEYYRPHELLNGLWELGVRRYPVIPDFPDIYSWSHEHAKTIYDEKEILAYQTALIDKFKPQVIIGHDLKGEYGHGAHILNAYCLLDAVEAANWQTKKLYLHLYGENQIILDGDEPLERFGGATVFETACRGFGCHKSQQQFFTVEQSGAYDMRKFGLYRSTVGADSGNDIFENITLYRDEKAAGPQNESLPEPPTPPAETADSSTAAQPAKADSDDSRKELFLPQAKNDSAFLFVGSITAAAFSLALALAIAATIFFRKR